MLNITNCCSLFTALSEQRGQQEKLVYVRKSETKEREREGGEGRGRENDRQPLLLRTFRVPLTTSLATRAVLPLLYDTCVYDESVCKCV